MGAFAQIAIMLVQLFPYVLKAMRAYQDYHAINLTKAHRVALTAGIKKAVDDSIVSKDTSAIEALFKDSPAKAVKTGEPAA